MKDRRPPVPDTLRAPLGEAGAPGPAPGSAAPDGVFGRYEVQSLLGRGGMGEVWRVRDPALGRTVALKVLLPSRAEDWAEDLRFEDEARLGSQLPTTLIEPEICKNCKRRR